MLAAVSFFETEADLAAADRLVALPDGVSPSRGGLDEPIIEAFRVGTMTLTWDGSGEVVVVEAREATDDDADEDDDEDDGPDPGNPLADGPDLLRVQLSAPAVRGFIVHANRVVASGRLPCPKRPWRSTGRGMQSTAPATSF